MSVGLKIPEVVHSIKGVELASVSAGIKSNNAADMVMLKFAPETITAGVFTKNSFCAAPVTVCRIHLEQTRSIKALLINSGNANAGTGERGLENTKQCCYKVADCLDIEPVEVLPFSTGVISQQLDLDIMLSGISKLSDNLSENHWEQAATGIMTTDTMPKIVSKQSTIAGQVVTVTGISKGAGMIRPDMATLLAFIVTDAKVAEDDLQKCLEKSVNVSFNAISIDGDTSTNDSCILSATGQVEGETFTQSHDGWDEFQSLINDVCIELAQAIVRDGEGATKFITINIKEGGNEQECREVAYTLAHSPLVKTAFFASDPNVGRLLAAVGRSQIEALDITSTSIALDEVDIVIDGEQAASYTEERGQMVMDREEITITVSLKRGVSAFTLWTCDLSHEYVRINAEYRS